MRVLVFAVLLTGLSVHAQIVKCVDERGVTHYTDRPPPGCKGGEVEIRGQPPISGKIRPAKEDLQRDEREFQRRKIQREREEQAELKKLAQAKQRCDNARAELQRASAVRRPGDANAHEARLRRLNDELSAKCR